MLQVRGTLSGLTDNFKHKHNEKASSLEDAF